MANQNVTLLDIAKLNAGNPAVPLIEEALPNAPEFGILPARPITGISFDTTVKTANPIVSFRNSGEGSETIKSAYANKTFSCFYLDGPLQIDVATASRDARGSDHVKGLEAQGVVTGGMVTIGSQIWYGTAADAKGFPGAASVVDSSLVVDATGTTSNTGSSVYLVVALPGFMELLVGNESAPVLGDWRIQRIADATGKYFDAHINSFQGHVGAAFYNKYALVRIKNLTAESGKGLTDSLISQALELLPSGVTPTHIFMSRRSRFQLMRSRTPVNTLQPNSVPTAPIPVESYGIPIVETGSIINTEAIA